MGPMNKAKPFDAVEEDYNFDAEDNALMAQGLPPASHYLSDDDSVKQRKHCSKVKTLRNEIKERRRNKPKKIVSLSGLQDRLRRKNGSSRPQVPEGMTATGIIDLSRTFGEKPGSPPSNNRPLSPDRESELRERFGQIRVNKSFAVKQKPKSR
jgi:hypothetical protein